SAGFATYVTQPVRLIKFQSIELFIAGTGINKDFSVFCLNKKASHGHLAHVVFITGITPRPIFSRYRSKHRTPVCKKISRLYGMKPEHKFVILHKNTLFRSISITGSE